MVRNGRGGIRTWKAAQHLAIAVAWVSAAAHGCAPFEIRYASEIVSLDVGEMGWVLTQHELVTPRGREIHLPARESGNRLSTAWVDDEELWVAYEIGNVYRSTDRGRTWTRMVDGFVSPDLVLMQVSLRRPVPRQFVRANDGTLYLATVGRGVMRFDEDTSRWVDATWAFDFEGSLHPLAWTVRTYGDGVAAGFVSTLGIVPPDLTAVLGPLFRRVDEPGGPVTLIPLDSSVRTIVDIGELDGMPMVASLGNGLLLFDGDGWQPLGPTPTPADLAGIDVADNGAIAAVAYSGDAWLRDPSGSWQQVRCGGHGPAAVDVRLVRDRMAVATGRSVEIFEPNAVSCPPRGGARVLLAFSQHTNLYHSYRGDTPDEDGFGKDFYIIANTLGILQRHPQFHNDWDIDNLFSLDDWFPTYAPELLGAIQARIAAGVDGMRVMSHNNGLMAGETPEELSASIELAKESLEAFVPGRWSPGVQPQEHTYTPAHVRTYTQSGIDWLTLYYSASSFTAFRNEIPLELPQAHGVLTLSSQLYPETMTVVPVYHHADIGDHGGLANWLRQLHQNLEGTAVLVIHADADADNWLGLEADLEAVEQMNADWVVPARLEDIVAQVAPSATITIQRDLADGAFDGFSSWTEKPVNHRFFTRIVRSRLASDRARALVEAPPPAMQQALDASATARHRALSTTHFGLANPALHPDREAAGEEITTLTEDAADEALAIAVGIAQLPPRSAHNVKSVPVTFVQPVSEPLASFGGAQPTRTVASTDGERMWLAGSLEAESADLLEQRAPNMQSSHEPPSGWGPMIHGIEVSGPRLRVDSVDHQAEPTAWHTAVGERAVVHTVVGTWNVGLGGYARYDWLQIEEDDAAWWVDVTVVFPTLDESQAYWLEETQPIAFGLGQSPGWSVARRLFTGEVAEYYVDTPMGALNAHAANGWAVLKRRGSARGASVLTYAPLRSAPAFLPLRLQPTTRRHLEATVMPFGALWGDTLEHRPHSTLGTGVGEQLTRLAAENIVPTAPVWNGECVRFLARVQPSTRAADHSDLDGARDGVLVVDAQGKPEVVSLDCP